jgi:hypothetical protein
MFLRFVWGQSRLPTTLREKFSTSCIHVLPAAVSLTQKSALQSLDRSEPDVSLPEASTCFFNLKVSSLISAVGSANNIPPQLPKYSTRDVLRQRLLYAVENCTVCLLLRKNSKLPCLRRVCLQGIDADGEDNDSADEDDDSS